MRRLAGLAAAAILAGALGAGAGAQAPREVHGMADAFALPGVALAWAVARDAGSGDATVVIRVAAERERYVAVAVTGIDPFTRGTKRVLAATPIAGALDVAVARAHFADYPRTELALYATEAMMREGAAALVVYYLGVPDTTPEFANRAALDAYLAGRIAGIRGTASGARP